MTFYQRRNIAVLGAAQQIAFSMTGYRSVFRGSFLDRDGMDDLTADCPLGLMSQVLYTKRSFFDSPETSFDHSSGDDL